MPSSISLDYILFISPTKSRDIYYKYFHIYKLLSPDTEYCFNYNSKLMKEPKGKAGHPVSSISQHFFLSSVSSMSLIP